MKFMVHLHLSRLHHPHSCVHKSLSYLLLDDLAAVSLTPLFFPLLFSYDLNVTVLI